MGDSKLRRNIFARKGQSVERKFNKDGITLFRRVTNGSKFERPVASKLRSAKA